MVLRQKRIWGATPEVFKLQQATESLDRLVQTHIAGAEPQNL